jgi:undecaprenyl-diphosphatase
MSPWAVVAVLSGLGFAILAVAARTAPYLPFDPPVSHVVQSYEAEWLHVLAGAVSWLGFPPQVDVLVVVLALAFWLSGRRRQATGVILAGASAGGLYLLVQLLVQQPRPSPDLVRVASSLPTGAFPSGHETTFTAVLGFLAYVGWTHARGRLVGWSCVCGAALFLVLMAWARLYQGDHWLSDLAGGLLLGSFCLALTVLGCGRS